MKEDLNTLRNAFQIASGEVISLVGGGGKTTLMFALARELAIPGKVVITTTTTKIFPPDSKDSPCLLISGDAGEIIDFIVKEGPKIGHVTIANEVDLAPGKLRGISPELIARLSEMESVAAIIVEADGAAHRSLKAPNIDYEPVIPANSSLVIPVIGIDVLGFEMREEYVFRSDIASRLTGLATGDIITPKAIATLITHPEGIAWNSPDHARIIPFVNKVDMDRSLPMARAVALEIIKMSHNGIHRVVLGHAKLFPPVAEVILL